MKRIFRAIALLALVLGGCARPVESSTPPPTEPPAPPAPIRLTALNLSPTQTYDIYDFHQDQLLLLIYDTEKRDPLEDETAQAPKHYFESFLLYDVARDKITAEYPIDQFGHCLSAVWAYDGIFYTLVTQDGQRPTTCSLLFQTNQDPRTVCELPLTLFNTDHHLCRLGDEVIFSYRNELTDGAFGVSKIGKDLTVTPLLTFTADQGNSPTNLVTLGDRYLYGAEENGLPTVYAGTLTGEVTTIRLSEGEKLPAFCLTGDYIVLCVTRANDAPASPGMSRLVRFDQTGKQVDEYDLSQPLFTLTGTENNTVCGRVTAANPAYLQVFSLGDAIAPVEVAEDTVGHFNLLISDGASFVLAQTTMIQPPQLWLLPAEEFQS